MDNCEYYDRVYGCWFGKNIGGSIGIPVEGTKEFLSVPAAEPSEILPNDDIDLQLVWLDILKKKGVKINSSDLAEGWLNNITYPCDEYGFAKVNLKLGLKPPVTGYYNNWFHNGMGAPIRSEIWACIAPGRPEVAAWYAWQDASVDHWEEGVYGEIFLAALESAAFYSRDLKTVIGTALSFIPGNSAIARVAKRVSSLHGEGMPLKECRDSLLIEFGHHNFTDCVQNIGFIIAGLLYGEGDFLRTIVSAVNCGYDTDCTGATAGAIAGIMTGREKLLASGYASNGKVVTGKGIRDIEAPETLSELTKDIMELGKKVKDKKDLPALPASFSLPPLPDFSPPLSYAFEISEPFELEGIERAEEAVLKNEYNNFTMKIFKSSFFDLNPYFRKPDSAIFLKGIIKIPKKKKVKLFPASTDGVKMWLDGKLILSHHQHSEFIPASHRPGSPLAEAEIDGGEHVVLLEVIRCNGKLDFAWIVANRKNFLLTRAEYQK
ncbi:MAG: ADP-ribosylglycohydrolase family protein [Candidatus Omnitrophica bacterium]|nr:ADP-ribosylglycohydrolase family protein [Candidatus Omnitrophota bacterium]